VELRPQLINIQYHVLTNLLISKRPSMEIDSSRLRRDRILFYLGLALFSIGLPGFLAGSWLHDVMRIPVIGDSYTQWGWINQLFALLGLFMALLGGGLVGLSLRGGIISDTETVDGAGEMR